MGICLELVSPVIKKVKKHHEMAKEIFGFLDRDKTSRLNVDRYGCSMCSYVFEHDLRLRDGTDNETDVFCER